MIEPAYQNKYPPLGLMKIATYHKLKGDNVEFFKGCSKDLRLKRWGRIYVSSLFSFYWSQTVKTIEFYKNSVKTPSDLYVGGVLASLMTKDLEEATRVTVIPGLLDKPGMLGFRDKIIVDHLIPDYSILDDIEYDYPVSDSYFGYATRGCPNRCKFCAVPLLEPEFQGYAPLRQQIEGIESAFGTKKDLVLLDNNVLKSPRFTQIIDDIISLGFGRGEKYNNRLRHVDFNQGIDARRITPHKMKLLAKIAIHPLRFAFDTPGIRTHYEKAVKLASENEIRRMGTYVLFNYRDHPQGLFERLEYSIKLNKRYGVQISSFPMKFVPFDSKDRSFIGGFWNKRWLRGVQCILLATRGMVSPNPTFFHTAFGQDKDEFFKILSMPEHYIIHRFKYRDNETKDWEKIYDRLTDNQKYELIKILSKHRINEEFVAKTPSSRLKKILEFYIGEVAKAK